MNWFQKKNIRRSGLQRVTKTTTNTNKELKKKKYKKQRTYLGVLEFRFNIASNNSLHLAMVQAKCHIQNDGSNALIKQSVSRYVAWSAHDDFSNILFAWLGIAALRQQSKWLKSIEFVVVFLTLVWKQQ